MLCTHFHNGHSSKRYLFPHTNATFLNLLTIIQSDAQVPRSDSNQTARLLELSQLFGISDADFLDGDSADNAIPAPKAENTSESIQEKEQDETTCGDGYAASEDDYESSSFEDQDSERENTAIPTSSLYQSQSGYNWADSSDDDDLYCSTGTHETGPSSVKKYQKSVKYGSPSSSRNGFQDQHLGTASLTSQSSEPDRYDAGYEGPSRSLNSHRGGMGRTSQWGFPTGERWEEIQEDFQLQLTQLHNASSQDIGALRVFNESPTISPEEEDLHDREMRKVFVDLHSGLRSDAPTGTMHIIDWKTLLKPDPDIEGQFILDYVYPRLCDVVATIIFESHPPALDAFLNMFNTTVEWWHRPHYPAPGTFNIVIRRHQNEVIVGTYSDHVFRVCWSRFLRVKITPNGRWSEYFAFNGPATSPKVNGEINWSEDAFECVKRNSDTSDSEMMDCWKPNEAFFEGRHLALHLLQHTLGQGEWISYRRKNTVHYVVDGKTSVLEERSVRRVLRQSRKWDDQAE